MAEQANEYPEIAWANFLESTPPNTVAEIPDAIHLTTQYAIINQPDLILHCTSEICNGPRVFFWEEGNTYLSNPADDFFIKYKCRNCNHSVKKFAVSIAQHPGKQTAAMAIKYGEFPIFGPPTPARVITILGPDREIFLKGRRCENQGLGIGAFAYYRRVVENQKNRIIAEIKKVASRIGATEDTLKLFDKAITETQFSKAIDDISAAIPPALMIQGQNPLRLLHSALSQGLHELPDEDCLQIAQSIRIILTELAERISQALKDEAELRDAVSMLLKPKQVNESQTDS